MIFDRIKRPFMCKWEILMGGVCKKNSFQANRASIITGSRSAVQSLQQFSEEFQKQLNDETVQELVSVFRMIDISSQVMSKSLFKFMNQRAFRNIFKEELEKYDQKFKKSGRKGRKVISNCLTNHCFGVLSVYLDLIEHVNDPHVLNNILVQTAISHSFINNAKLSFKLHDHLLQKFFRHELGQYMNRRTRKALKRFLRLISRRLQILVEQEVDSNNMDDISDAMEYQKSFVQTRIDKLANLTEIYVNPLRKCTSEYSFIPADAVYPGTSKGSKGTTVKANK